MKCSQCGAVVKRGDGRFCSHCGAAHPDRPRITADEWRTHVERFEQALRDPAHASAMAAPAPKPHLFTTVVFPAIFLVMWVGIGSVVTVGFAQGPGGFMFVFPLGMVIVGVVMVGSHIVGSLRKARAPVHREIAVVIDERTEVWSRGTGSERRSGTSYYATLQFVNGAREELPTDGHIVGMVAPGDIGLAVIRGGDLIDFHRYPV